MKTTIDPRLAQLESDTADFRAEMARRHRARRREAHLLIAGDGPRPGLIDSWDPSEPLEAAKVAKKLRKASSLRSWHEARDNGQRYRFRRLGQCGSRVVIATCDGCKADRKPIPEGCGIARLCLRCATENAKIRRARFGSARARAALVLGRLGYTKARRGKGPGAPGGKWGDKMITLTVPHFDLADVDDDAEFLDVGAVRADSTAMARIYAVRAAWPLFARLLRGWFATAGGRKRRTRAERLRPRMRPIAVPQADGSYQPPPLHRAFEWTPGRDGQGHPHYHVWLLAPFLPEETVERFWRESLAAVGVPVGDYVRVKVQAFRDFDGAASAELVKVGRRQALEYSRLYVEGPSNAFEYSDGWTMMDALRLASPDVVPELYKALEGMRLTQGSRGLFVEDEPATCDACKTQGCWHVRFEPAPEPSGRDPERSAIEAECSSRAPP